jgi:hypothetical protein
VDNVLFTVPQQGAATCCRDILVPVDIIPIGELYYKAIFGRTHNNRRLVLPAALSPDMTYNAEWPERSSGKTQGSSVQRMLEQDKESFTEFLQKLQRIARGLIPLFFGVSLGRTAVCLYERLFSVTKSRSGIECELLFRGYWHCG